MKDFEGKVAVVTGAASGIGKALAQASAHRGMKVVLADIRADAVAEAEKELASEGTEVISVETDVSNGLLRVQPWQHLVGWTPCSTTQGQEL